MLNNWQYFKRVISSFQKLLPLVLHALWLNILLAQLMSFFQSCFKS